ncbi:MAG: acyl-CoA carboxylase subunit beta [Burkholderiaceae bacterium]|nr:acyl-CoA carboxylase subunit beta [Burkholderiaceae bacterium]
MPLIASRIDTGSSEFHERRAGVRTLVARLREMEARTAAASARAQALFARRGQLLPRERIERLLDPGAPWLELSTVAGAPAGDSGDGVGGAGVITGIGFVSGVRCFVNASDSGIDAGAIQAMGREKILRGQQIALENRLPYLQLIESAGANLLKYRVEGFIEGGRIFYNLARLSAAGIPVIAVVHGSSTAGGAYMPGLSDYVVMVRGRAKAFLAGPPLLLAATGEIATDEELGGAQMHTAVSGLGEYLAEDDADALRIARDLLARLGWNDGPAQGGNPRALAAQRFEAPRYPPSELDGIAPLDLRQPLDMRELIARIVDASDLLEFGSDYGPQTLCGHAAIHGMRVGIVTNNGPLDPAGSNKATHFIQACCQTGTPLVFLQNTTGYIVGKHSEQAGMIKHGSKMIQAVSNASVPTITIHCGASFGAGNYGMCGRAFGPRFVFSWPNAKTAVMGGEQAALTMRIVSEGTARRKGEPVDETRLAALGKRIIDNFESQSSAFHTSALLLDDGVIDPRDTRETLAFVLQTCLEGDARSPRPMQFGVSRP